MSEYDIPAPQELGLPEKYSAWRGCQEQMIYDSLRSQKRFRGMRAPTGTGKTGFYFGLAKKTGERTVILTRTKGLQSQVMHEFESTGLVNVMGKRNYPCDGGADDWNCERGSRARCIFAGTTNCPHSQAHFRFLNSPIGVTNYANWVAVNKYGNGFGTVDHLVLDEAHDVPGVIADAMQLHFSANEEKILGVKFPTISTDTKEWKTWAGRVRPQCEELVKTQEELIKFSNSPKTLWIDHLHQLTNLSRKLADLMLIRADDWIVEEMKENVGRGYQLDPIRIGPFAERILFRRIPKVTFISATIHPKTLWQCGIRSADMDYFEYPSPFDPDKSPVYYYPAAKVDRSAGEHELHQLVDAIDRIQVMRQDRRGIIVTPSYDLRNAIVQRSEFSRNMLVNHRDDKVDDVVSRFARMPPGAVLVSPSVGTGYNFEDDAARWMVIPKIPFPDRSKPINVAREAVDRSYGAYHAAQQMEQFAGRTTRSEDDWSEAFLLDANMDWYWKYNHGLLGDWFKQRLRQVREIPQPLSV